ncbi:MAG: hypothetical protein WCO07_01085, partial [bacterium]
TFVFLAIFVVVLVVGFMPRTQATDGDKVYGYAWSGNTGWISFNNCTDPINRYGCVGVSYGVTYDSGTGVLSGYAWSENVGWIQFGGLSGFPSGGGTISENAKINLTTGTSSGNLTGWAKVVSPKASNDAGCLTYDDDNNGCWDGWISLSGTSSSGTNYGVSFNPTGTAKDNSFAWGSDVLGWIDFKNVVVDTFTTTSPGATQFYCNPTVTEPRPSSCCVTNTDPSPIFAWETTGMTICYIYRSNGTVSIFNIPSGEISVGSTKSIPITEKSSSFYLKCFNSGGTGYTSTPDILITRQLSCTGTDKNKMPQFIER